MTTNEWLTPAEAGALRGVGPDRMAQLAREGAVVSMRTPGGHLRIRRDSVENLANTSSANGTDHASGAEGEPDGPEELPPPATLPKWEQVPPWKRRVREAEADLQVLKFENEKQQLLDTRAERDEKRDRAAAERTAVQVEAARLKQLKARALLFMPFGVPNDVAADVARQIESAVTSERFPADISRVHTDTLLRAELDRHLTPWRTREARRERVRTELEKRNSMFALAVLKAELDAPSQWDYQTVKDLGREVRKALEDEYYRGMTQDEANEIALDVLGEWMEDHEDEA